MDEKLDILLGNEKNINSINVDNTIKIELMNNLSEITEYTVNDVVNSTEQFDLERQENEVYRIYGRIEYLSLINGIKDNDDNRSLSDFFNTDPTVSNPKTIFNSFDFHIVAPHDSVSYKNISNTNDYLRPFIVITDKIDIDIIDAGFNTNIYGEQIYGFNIKLDIDIKNYVDNLGIPLTELFLYAQYNEASNEAQYYTKWSTSTGNPIKAVLKTKDLNIGDTLTDNNGFNVYDKINFIAEEFSVTQVSAQTYIFRVPYKKTTTKELEFKYNPLIPIKLRDFDSVVSTAKLPEIAENSTVLEVYDVDNPINSVKLIKSSSQTVSTTIHKIIDWDSADIGYSSYAYDMWYSWDSETGKLTINKDGTYKVKYSTSFFLTNYTDKYIGYTSIHHNSSQVNNMTRIYQESYDKNGGEYEDVFSSGDTITTYVKLILNSNERRLNEIPDYALVIPSEGKFVWRDILPQGNIDPLTGDGVDYPFFNGKRYVFSPILLSIPPNLSNESWLKHYHTRAVFSEINYTDDAEPINVSPLTDINNIGKPCQ